MTMIAEEVLAPRLPVVGVIKIGRLRPKQTSRGGTDFQPPMKLDHFLIGKTTRGDDNNYVRDDDVHQALGEKPRALDVRLPFDGCAQVFHCEMTHYAGRTKKTHECDGRVCVDPATHAERPCDRRAGRDCPCKPYGRLTVMLEASPTFGGLHVYRTRSWETVSAMQTFLLQLEHEFGSLRGLPCRMELHESEVRYKDGQDVKVGTAWRVALVLRASYEETRQALVAHHRANRIARHEILRLAAGAAEELDEVDAREAELLAAEFPDDPPEPELGGPGAPKSKLAEMNREIIDEHVSELRGLMARAEGSGLAFTDAQAAKLEEAIERRDLNALSTSVEWVKGKIEAAEREAERPGGTDEAGPDEAESGQGESTGEPAPPAPPSDAPGLFDEAGTA